MICIGILFTYCFMATPEQIDSFCLTYQPVVQQKGDGSVTASPGAKRRILANELTYRKLCNAMGR